LSGLNEYSENVYSQSGEDGILERLLELIGERNRFCVEFGAWDGLHLSNCANLIRNKGYLGVLIEADEHRYAELETNYQGFPNATTLRALVGFGTGDNLDTLLSDIPMPEDPDVLSVDIDGNDYHAWASIQRLRPKVVCIEFNPTVPNAVDFVQAADSSIRQGCGIRSLVNLGKEKGYELACCTSWNAFFVDARFFARLEIADNSLESMRTDTGFVTYIFSGYDGRILLEGYRRLPWHEIPFAEKKAQQLPSFLAGYPGDYSLLKQHAFGIYKRLRRDPRGR
jgi:hypothetical protein